MGKMKIGMFCYLVADILAKYFQKFLLSSPLLKINCLSKPLNFIGCHGNRKAKFAKKYKIIISGEAIRGV